MKNIMLKKEKKKRPTGRAIKSVILTLRITPDEFDAWSEKAADNGLRLREYVLAPHRKVITRKGEA
jgi:hypothetical protein